MSDIVLATTGVLVGILLQTITGFSFEESNNSVFRYTSDLRVLKGAIVGFEDETIIIQTRSVQNAEIAITYDKNTVVIRSIYDSNMNPPRVRQRPFLTEDLKTVPLGTEAIVLRPPHNPLSLHAESIIISI